MRKRIRKIFKKYSGREVADHLEELGYFKHADPADVEMLKNEVSIAYKEYGKLSSIYALEGGRHYPRNYRLYTLNKELLYEIGGYDKYLAEIEPTLSKLNISITIDEEQEEHSETKGLIHYITINGTRYTIFDNFRDFSSGSTVAAKKFIEILNDVLIRHASEERVYPMGRGIYGQMIFLTQKQFRFISSVYANDENKPLTVKAWARMHNVK